MTARYPAAPLIAMFDDIPTAAHVMATTERTIHRWVTGGLSPVTADQAAVRVGLHPVDLWPTWFDDALAEDAERGAA